MIEKAANVFSTESVEYRLNVTITPVAFGTPELVTSTMDNTHTSPVKVKLVDADSIISLKYIGDEIVSGQEASAKLFNSETTAGKKDIKVVYGDDKVGTKEAHLTLVMMPGKPSLFLKKFTTTYNTIAYFDRFLHGNLYNVMIKKKGKWKKVKDLKITRGVANTYVDQAMVISKLKENTKYQLRFVPYVPIDGKTYQSKASQTFNVATGLKSAPAIKRIQISNVKAKKAKRTNLRVPGYWSGGVWHKGYYLVSKPSTSFSVRVLLKKKIKGTSGLMINDHYVNGKGTTFKTKMTYANYLKGKK